MVTILSEQAQPEPYTWVAVPETHDVQLYSIIRKPSVTCSNTFIIKSSRLFIVIDPGADIEQIKVYLEEHLTEEQIAKKLGCARETVSRKIAKWMPTEDFREWLSSRWLSQYNKFSSDGDLQVEAFMQLTRLLCVSTVRRQEIKAEIKEKVLVATVDLTKLSDNDRNAILRAEEALTRAETAAGS